MTALDEHSTTMAGSPSSLVYAAGGDRGGVGYGWRKLLLLRGIATAAEGLDIVPGRSVPARLQSRRNVLGAEG